MHTLCVDKMRDTYILSSCHFYQYSCVLLTFEGMIIIYGIFFKCTNYKRTGKSLSFLKKYYFNYLILLTKALTLVMKKDVK